MSLSGESAMAAGLLLTGDALAMEDSMTITITSSSTSLMAPRGSGAEAIAVHRCLLT